MPFTSQWYAAPHRERVRRLGVDARAFARKMANRLPNPAMSRLTIMVVLVLGSSWFVPPRTILSEPEPVFSRDTLTLAEVPDAPRVNSTISTGGIPVTSGGDRGPFGSGQVGDSQPIMAPTADPHLEQSLLPKSRILLLYGLPGDPSSGMVGSHETARLLEILQERAAEYQALDPDRPIILGLEIIATLGQKSPGSDGTYIRETSVATLYEYVEFTRANNMVLFLDVHIGRRTVQQEVGRLERFLMQPHVHLAIDTEFDVDRTEVPTMDIGSTSAAEIRWVQDYLVKLASTHTVPPKILMVHVFAENMIENRALLRPVRGVQLVIDASLWADAQSKKTAYETLVANAPGEFGGIMISSKWDDPALSTEDILALPGPPDIVIFQ